MDERSAIFAALEAFIASRPGFDWRNYATSADYRRDQRTAQQDGADARALLRAAQAFGVSADDLKYALRHAFSGRLTWNSGRQELEYCCGQYYPTEYRAAAASVLALALRNFRRAEFDALHGKPTTGAELRQWARRAFGAGIARRHFN
jgi:hypothetical protein